MYAEVVNDKIVKVADTAEELSGNVVEIHSIRTILFLTVKEALAAYDATVGSAERVGACKGLERPKLMIGDTECTF